MEGKWGVRAHQTQEMKGKEGSGDLEGREAKSGLASSGRGLDTSGEKGFFADADDFLYLSWHEYKYPGRLVYAEMHTAHWW